MEVTAVTVGTVVSITKALLAKSELAAPGSAKVKVALFNATSFMEAPLSEIVIIPPIAE